jgi:hypothetical protein
MSKFKAANILFAFILIIIAIILYKNIFLNIHMRQLYTNKATAQIDGFTGCEKGFCS